MRLISLFPSLPPSLAPLQICPYYLMRQNTLQADLVLMPYNYLLDAGSRQPYQVRLPSLPPSFPPPTHLFIHFSLPPSLPPSLS